MTTDDQFPEGLWVFGYGSLMWRPDFDHVERIGATVEGYARRFCIWSHHWRGTVERPGLVLGLDAGGACRGVAYRVAPPLVDRTIAYLRAREQVTGVYLERRLHARLGDGRAVETLAYVVDRNHEQYAAPMPEGRMAEVIRGATGVGGPNVEYLRNTVEHLLEMGCCEPELARLAARFSDS